MIGGSAFVQAQYEELQRQQELMRIYRQGTGRSINPYMAPLITQDTINAEPPAPSTPSTDLTILLLEE